MRITATASPCLKSGMISVFITNLGKYNEGELVGEWLELPATSKEIEHCLMRIGIDGIHYEEYFLTDYESSIDGLSSHILEYSLLDELNELATQLAMLSPDEINLYQAAIEIGSSTSSIHDLIHLADNLDSFQQLSGVNNEYDLGYYWIEESGCYDLAQLGHLSHYFDYERYGRDVCLEQGGVSALRRIWLTISPFSPRPWGCFSMQIQKKNRQNKQNKKESRSPLSLFKIFSTLSLRDFRHSFDFVVKVGFHSTVWRRLMEAH